MIATTILSSSRILALLRDVAFAEPLCEARFREAAYLSYLPWAAREPDHVFNNAWHYLQETDPTGANCFWVGVSLSCLSGEFLEATGSRIDVKMSSFGAWQQSIVSRISGVSIAASARARSAPGDLGGRPIPLGFRVGFPQSDLHGESLPNSPVFTPFDAAVEDYIAREGLHESHLHLNGSTHAEVCWLRALARPHTETQRFAVLWSTGPKETVARIRELAHSIDPSLGPAGLRRNLLLARALRRWLTAAAFGGIPDDQKMPADASTIVDGGGYDPVRLCSRPDLSVQSEFAWQIALLRRFARTRGAVLERMYYLYLLLQNQHYRLLVQSEEQYGFDQFQKLTFTGLRDVAEKEYVQRFRSMHGPLPGRSRIGYLEGRVAPKSTVEQNANLLRAVLGAYSTYLRGGAEASESASVPRMRDVLADLDSLAACHVAPSRQYFRLALVFHFIKKPWAASPAALAGPFRFFAQRTELANTARTLKRTLERWPRLTTWVRGIDAASNEMHAPPEVFATAYRICARSGVGHRTFHVGEDFPHLLTGIRHILDAVELLDLRKGDRIGHATAMGIAPGLWLSRVPEQLLIRRGEWMLDLLAAWRLLRLDPSVLAEANELAIEIGEIANHVFGVQISPTLLEEVMRLRYLDIHLLRQSRAGAWDGQMESSAATDEARVLSLATQEHKLAVDLLWAWMSDRNLWTRSEALIEVSANRLSERCYVAVQQQLMNVVARRGLVVETLPSSNVRISVYKSFDEHHAFRWMRVPDAHLPGDPEIMVSLGSDDPGIFAGDLRGEFYHLYASLRNRGLGDRTALNYLAPINERGRQYRFHHESLS